MMTPNQIVTYLHGVARYYREDAEQCRALARHWVNRVTGISRILRRSAEEYEAIAEAIDRMVEEIQR